MKKERPAWFARISQGSRYRQDLDELTVGIGGFLRFVDVGLSYVMSARMLLESARTEQNLGRVAPTIAFLQRHSFELFLKSYIELAEGVFEDDENLQRLRESPAAELFEQKPNQVHGLVFLARRLRRALAAVSAPEMPHVFEELAVRFTDREKDDPAFFRYERNNDDEPNYRETVSLTLGADQEGLEQLYTDWHWPSEHEDHPYADLARQGDWYTTHVGAWLYELEPVRVDVEIQRLEQKLVENPGRDKRRLEKTLTRYREHRERMIEKGRLKPTP